MVRIYNYANPYFAVFLFNYYGHQFCVIGFHDKFICGYCLIQHVNSLIEAYDLCRLELTHD